MTTKTKQTLIAYLVANALTENPNDFYAIIKNVGTLDPKSFAQIIKDEGCELKEETIEDVINRYERTKMERLLQGFHIKTPMGTSSLTTHGTFHGERATFDPDVHKIDMKTITSNDLRSKLKNIHLEVLGLLNNGPIVNTIIDSFSGKIDSIITPNNVLTLEGERIRIEGESENVGIEFVNCSTQERTKVTQIIKNDPKTILFMIPNLEVGTYNLELSTQYSKGKTPLKEPRTSTFLNTLSVVSDNPETKTENEGEE